MSSFLDDVRYALRVFAKAPGFTLVAIVTLALGIGANTAIFTVVNSLLIRPLPYAAPDRLVMVWQDYRARGGPADEWATPGNYADWRRATDIFEALAVLTGWRPTLTGGAEPEPIAGEQVSHEYFAVLGVTPALGRDFTQSDDVPNARRVAIVSHGLWVRRFGGDPNVVGRTITLNGEPHEVVGVLPDRVRPIVSAAADIWRPLRLNTANPPRGAVILRAVARLPDGISLSQAQAAATTLARQLDAAHPEFNEDIGIHLTALHDRIVGDIKPGLLALLGSVGVVLLIACANIANLLLARGSARARELGVRVALGARRGRIFRQLLTESVLLSFAGGVAGVLVGVWAVDGLIAMAPADVPRLDEIGLDTPVLAFAALVTLATGLLCGLAPAWQSARGPLTRSLKDGTRGSGGGGGRRLRRALVVSEIALALVLLSGGGLLLQTFVRLQSADLGFNPQRVLVGFVNPPRTTYETAQKHLAFYDRVLEKAAALPGVERSALASVLPLSGDSDMSFALEGRPGPRSASDTPVTWYRLVSSGYFETMGMAMVRGRAFAAREAAPTVVVNETFARRFFPGEDPIGRRLRFGDDTAPSFAIVGVVADAKVRGAREAARVETFIPYWQFTEPGMNVVLKTAIEPAQLAGALRRAVYSIDANVPVSGIGTLSAMVEDSIDQPRFVAMLAAGFAALALALAAVGIYGVMAYAVSQRTAEIGVRMALGATSPEVFRLVVGDGLRLAAVGIALGAAGSLITARWLTALLFGVRPGDPVTLAVTAGLLVLVALAACSIPAHRATQVDPMVALRTE